MSALLWALLVLASPFAVAAAVAVATVLAACALAARDYLLEPLKESETS